MAISLYHPRAVSVQPDGGAMATGDFWADRGAFYPGLPLVPRLTDALTAWQPGIDKPSYAPPNEAYLACWARQWEIEAEITGSTTLTIPLETLTPAFADTWPEAVQQGTSVFKSWKEGDSSAEENWVQLSVNIGTDHLWYDYAAGLWWPGLSINITSRDFGALGSPLRTALLGSSGGGSSAGESDVTVNFGGTVFVPLYTSSTAVTLSGEIFLRPKNYLLAE